MNNTPIPYTNNVLNNQNNIPINQPTTYTTAPCAYYPSAQFVSSDLVEQNQIQHPVPTAPPHEITFSADNRETTRSGSLHTDVVPLHIINDSHQYNTLHNTRYNFNNEMANNSQNWGICKGCDFQFIRCEADKNTQSYFYCDQCIKNNLKKRCCASCIIS